MPTECQEKTWPGGLEGEGGASGQGRVRPRPLLASRSVSTPSWLATRFPDITMVTTLEVSNAQARTGATCTGAARQHENFLLLAREAYKATNPDPVGNQNFEYPRKRRTGFGKTTIARNFEDSGSPSLARIPAPIMRMSWRRIFLKAVWRVHHLMRRIHSSIGSCATSIPAFAERHHLPTHTLPPLPIPARKSLMVRSLETPRGGVSLVPPRLIDGSPQVYRRRWCPTLVKMILSSLKPNSGLVALLEATTTRKPFRTHPLYALIDGGVRSLLAHFRTGPNEASPTQRSANAFLHHTELTMTYHHCRPTTTQQHPSANRPNISWSERSLISHKIAEITTVPAQQDPHTPGTQADPGASLRQRVGYT